MSRTQPDTFAERLSTLTIRDRDRLARRVARATRDKDDLSRLSALEKAIDDAAGLRAARAAGVPSVTYPESLPVSAARDEILTAIRDHQVVVVAGETGSGKTTQIPKMCLELGRGIDGMIGHTQPRRLAARTVAERIAEELEVPLGTAVGYAVRFTDTVGDTTLIKVMTDGILLAEIRRDRLLLAYDTIIVDEAHERSLNIDFLLGYLTQLLPQRPDLKVVVTSATIDTDRFAKHFGAPVVEVSGRTYPVEIRYEPVSEDGTNRDRDLNGAIADAVNELVASGPGDVLVFLPGERDIRDAADALRASGPEGVEILPLYARLSAAEQHRAFRPHGGRRIVLATNVAETSLTVPGVRFVVDTGLARISRFSHRTKVQRLPIEAVSQASANQRSGRCGRVAPGICVRLYSEEDFAARPEFTDPEILRTNLASVILQMAAIGLGEIEAFPFLEPPDSRSIAAGRALLEELGAFDRHDGQLRLTSTGRRLAQLPVDPRLGRMVLSAQELDCLREVTIIAAALAVQDPRERPTDKAQAAEELHRRFVVADSDFLGLLSLWEYLAQIQSELSGNAFRRRCRAEYLNVLRVREWQDVASQIRRTLRQEGATANTEPAPPEHIHQALLSGLLSQIGMRDRVRDDYQGARSTRWQIGRRSALARRKPAWVMAGELIETERTWAGTVAKIEPAWAERVGAHLARRSYSEPWWDPRRGEAVAHERVTLYGLPVVSGRPVSFARVDAPVARELFIQRALVDGDWHAAEPAFAARNRARIARVRGLEARVRRPNLYAGDAALVDFYDGAIPDHVTNARRFDRWWRRAETTDPDLLDAPFGALLDPDARSIDLSGYPNRWSAGGLDFALSYRWEHGALEDGVTVEVPLGALNQIPRAPFSWHVPGFRAELVTALVHSLPKTLRRPLVPASDTVRQVLATTGPEDGPILGALARRLSEIGGVRIVPEDFDTRTLPPYLVVKFAVVDESGHELARSDDLDSCRREFRPQIRALLAAAVPELIRHGAHSWEFGEIPECVERNGIVGYPALVDEGDAVGVVVLDSIAAQSESMWDGTRRLLLLAAPLPEGHVQRRLSNEVKLALARTTTTVGSLIERCATVVADEIITRHRGPAFSADGFAAMAAEARAELVERVARLVATTGRVITATNDARARVDALAAGPSPDGLAPALADLRHQLEAFASPDLVASAAASHADDLLRYIAAATQRLDRLPGDLRRDSERQAVIDRVTARYERWRAARGAVDRSGTSPDDPDDPWWMIQELRVSLWAQSLGTATPVSEARIARILDA